MATKRARQQIIKTIQQEIQLTPREFAHALRVNDVWFRTLITTDQLPSVPALTTFLHALPSASPRTPTPSSRTRLTRTSRGLLSQRRAQTSRTDSLSLSLVVQ
jgi:hypothetical protein